MTLKVSQGQLRLPFCQNHSSIFVYAPILLKICMNANIMNTRFFVESLRFFTLRSSDLNTTLTYVLLDKFCPCLD